MTQWLFDATLHVNPSDSSLHVVAYANDGRVASKRFPPATAIAIREWLQSPKTWDTSVLVAKSTSAFLSYSHETGEIILTGHRIDRSFDVQNEEDMAKLVRLLKRLSPMPRETEPVIPNLLPKPTEAELRNRQIFLNPMPARGYSGTATAKNRAKPTLSREDTRKKLDEIASALLGL